MTRFALTRPREYGPRPASEHSPDDPEMAASFDKACTSTSRSKDGRTFACARPDGHSGEHYGRDRSGPVKLGYGR